MSVNVRTLAIVILFVVIVNLFFFRFVSLVCLLIGYDKGSLKLIKKIIIESS